MINNPLVCLAAIAAMMMFSPLVILKPAYSQNQSSAIGSFTGMYVNNDIGITLALPDGYVGNATVLNGELLVQALGPGHILSIEMLARGNSSESASALFLTATSGTPPEGCTEEKSYPTVSGLAGYLYTNTCSNQVYSAFMVDWSNQVLLVAMKSSTQGSQSAKSDFHNIVQSITLRSSGPSSSYTLDSLQSIQEQISLKNSRFTMNILSNSKISEFRFDQVNQVLSFRVNGTQDSPGKTIIPIGMLLNGPYTVSFDGRNYTNYFVHQDQTTGSIDIYLSYHHSIHTIMISGASVVPEFSAVGVGMVLTFVGALAILARVKPSLFTR